MCLPTAACMRFRHSSNLTCILQLITFSISGAASVKWPNVGAEKGSRSRTILNSEVLVSLFVWEFLANVYSRAYIYRSSEVRIHNDVVLQFGCSYSIQVNKFATGGRLLLCASSPKTRRRWLERIRLRIQVGCWSGRLNLSHRAKPNYSGLLSPSA